MLDGEIQDDHRVAALGIAFRDNKRNDSVCRVCYVVIVHPPVFITFGNGDNQFGRFSDSQKQCVNQFIAKNIGVGIVVVASFGVSLPVNPSVEVAGVDVVKNVHQH